MEDQLRSRRFVESSGDYRKLAAFSGEAVSQRMKMIRRFILEVRENEHRPGSELMQRARRLLESRTPNRVSHLFTEKKNLLFSRPRGFADLCANPPEDYSAVWLYTSNEGYEALFAWVKDILRSTRATQDEVKLATFVVELINIDLYNYWYRNPQMAAYEGWMYRGMSMRQSDFDILADKGDSIDIKKRYRSIPLALDSYTTDIDKAQSFINLGKNEIPVLLSLRAISLSDSSLQFYHSLYPESVVSPICTTSLKELSRFPEEEVLLRGGFYQILDVRHTQKRIEGEPLRIVEVATMNTNRDHPSTPQREKEARKLFGKLVAAERNLYCHRYCISRNNTEDANHYFRSLKNQEEYFKEQYNMQPPWL